MRFQAGVVPPSAQTQNKVIVNFGIDPHTLAFEQQNDDLRHAAVSCVVWAYPAKGDPVRAEGRCVPAGDEELFPVPAEPGAEARQLHFAAGSSR